MSRNSPLTIRDAGPDDRDTIVQFNAAMATETEDRRLDPETLRAGVEAVLQNPARGRYFLAERDGHVVAQTMITYEWSDWRNGNFWWIQSVYVSPDYRSAGVFTALYRHIERLAANDRTVCGIRLYVEKENVQAARTYLRLGMKPAHYNMLEVDFILGETAAADGDRA